MNEQYLVHAFDAKGNAIDVSGLSAQEIIDGAYNMITLTTARELLAFIGHTRTGIRHDWFEGTHVRAKIAYFWVSVAGVTREVYVTPWGRHCRMETKPEIFRPDRRSAAHISNVDKNGATDDARNLRNGEIVARKYAVRYTEVKPGGHRTDQYVSIEGIGADSIERELRAKYQIVEIDIQPARHW